MLILTFNRFSKTDYNLMYLIRIMILKLSKISAAVSTNHNTNQRVNVFIKFIVVPKMGLLFERTGTISSYPQMNLITAVIPKETWIIMFAGKLEKLFINKHLINKHFSNKTMPIYILYIHP